MMKDDLKLDGLTQYEVVEGSADRIRGVIVDVEEIGFGRIFVTISSRDGSNTEQVCRLGDIREIPTTELRAILAR